MTFKKVLEQVIDWLQQDGRISEDVSEVLISSDGSTKLVAIDEEPNHQIVHLFCFGETDRPTHQSFDPRPEVNMLAFDFLRIFFANRVLFSLDMTLVSAPTVSVITPDAKRL